ncbi:dTDP-4-dehydrorhamnose 3,5-epimerase family protein [Salinarimonas sp.]|uniref:dTDP-4-dehydrorhamnose 3,5-epimerase family protein n=1 Tax=Salinarimonas sp. TaxID=2766526 RepID=UPI0032D995D5
MSGRFDVLATEIEGLVALRRKPIGDARGFLERIYCADELEPVLGGRRIAQINRTLTRRRGAVRGLHFQHPPHAETKVVACLRGAVFDVAVDLRRGSPTFLAWHGRVLGAENAESLVVPEGFAHGFQALEDECELLYLHTAAYAPDAEGGLDATDPRIGIAWPLPIAERSVRDEGLARADGFAGIAA